MKFEDIYDKTNIQDDDFILEVKDILTTSNNRMNIVLRKFNNKPQLIDELNIRSPRGKNIQEKLFRLFYPEKSPTLEIYPFISFVRGYNCTYILGDNINYKEEIQKIIDLTPQYHTMVKRNFTLWEEILDKTEDVVTDIISEKIYYYMNDITTNQCPNGNRYKYDGYKPKKDKENGKITKPIKFCAKTGKCKCAKTSVSKNVSSSKGKYTEEQKNKINEKREKTILTNTGGKYSNNIHSKKGQEELDKRKTERYNKLISHCVENDLILEQTQENYQKARNENSVLNFSCNKCNSKIEYKASNDIYDIICRICNPSDNKPVSNEENELKDYIISLLNQNEQCIQSNQYIISPYELDITLPNRKIAFEYNGLYFHSHSMNKNDEHYHSRKLTLCWQKGYRLVSVFSDDWENNKQIVKNKIKSILIDTILENIEIKEINKNSEINFVKDYQFTIENTDYCLGYFNNGELIGTLSFKDDNLVYFNSRYNNKEILEELIKFYGKNIYNFKIDLNYDDWKKYKDVGFTMNERVLHNKLYITDHYHNKKKFLLENENYQDILYDCGYILCDYLK